MKKINFKNDVTKVNAETFNTFQNNIEEAVVPEGGTTGQILTKSSNEDNEVNWTDPIETQVINSLNAESTTSALSAYQGKVLNNRLMNIEDSSIYSTEETKVGTWIDGKPIYRKVYTIDALPNATWLHFSVEIQNVDTLISLRGVAKSASEAFEMPSAYDATHFDPIVANFNGTTIYEIRFKPSSDRTPYSAFTILEYTKTTD